MIRTCAHPPSPSTSYQHPILISEVAGSNTPPTLTEHLVLDLGIGVIQVQKELLEEKLQMRSAELSIVVLGQIGQPMPQGLQSPAAHLLTAVIQTFQQLCWGKTTAHKKKIPRIKKYICIYFLISAAKGVTSFYFSAHFLTLLSPLIRSGVRLSSWWEIQKSVHFSRIHVRWCATFEFCDAPYLRK